MARINISGFICERCNHKWVARNKDNPRVCPKCKSPYWDKPRRKKSAHFSLFRSGVNSR